MLIRYYISTFQRPISKMIVSKFPCLKEIIAIGNNLQEIPETLGSLPCLKVLVLSDNRLGQATNWNFLTSTFIRQNLISLHLTKNEVSAVIFKHKIIFKIYPVIEKFNNNVMFYIFIYKQN